MLDIRKIRENPEFYKEETRKKGTTIEIDEILSLDEKRRSILAEVEKLKAERNAESKRIGELKKKGENADDAVLAMRALGDKIAELDSAAKAVEFEQTEKLMHIPNIAPNAPEGESSEDNVVRATWGTPREIDFEAVDHKTLGERLGLFDFERGAKISGSGFPVYRGLGARLERALIQFFLDMHREAGFEETIP